jgi:prepilin-type N-terminal cleavage/methylation domain-containing protein
VEVMKRFGFKMIELVFVIVILGILAAVAIPKLAATREDAKDARACQNAAICVMDVTSTYTATGNTTTSHKSCQKAISAGVGINIDMTTHSINVTSTPTLCANLSKVYPFGGSRVSQ